MCLVSACLVCVALDLIISTAGTGKPSLWSYFPLAIPVACTHPLIPGELVQGRQEGAQVPGYSRLFYNTVQGLHITSEHPPLHLSQSFVSSYTALFREH